MDFFFLLPYERRVENNRAQFGSFLPVSVNSLFLIGDTNRMHVTGGCNTCEVQLGEPSEDESKRCQKNCEATLGCAWWHQWGPTCMFYTDRGKISI